MAQRHSQRGREPTYAEQNILKKAIEKNDTATIQKMIQQDFIDINADINKPDIAALAALAAAALAAPEYTALHYAVEQDKLQCVKVLTQLGADVTKTDRYYERKIPLQRAVDDSKSSIVYYFVKEYNQDISKLDQGYQRKIHAIIQQYERDNPQRHGQVNLQALQRSVLQLQHGLTNEQQKSSGLETRLSAEEQKSATLETRLSAEEQKSATLETRLSAEEQKSTALETRLSVEERKAAILEHNLIAEQQKFSRLETRLSAEERKSAALERSCQSLAAEKQKSQSLETKYNSQEERIRTVEDKGFDYAAANAKITKSYVELTELPINSILGALRAKKIILPKEKEEIEAIPSQSKRMEYLLDNIIAPSIKAKVGIKFKGLLEVMEDSEDLVFNSVAQKLGGSAAVPSC